MGAREKWIYVSDCEGRFYVGRKIKGHFHHSSFLAGGAIRAAGGIKVRQGKLLEINPNSGHYKPTQHHFKDLIKRLRKEGIDVDSEDVKVVYPNDLIEKRLMTKYQLKMTKCQLKSLADLDDEVIDSIDRHVTKIKVAIKKNMKSFLEASKESIESIQEWFHEVFPNTNHKNKNKSKNNNSSSSKNDSVRKSKSKHKRKSSGFFESFLAFFGISDEDGKGSDESSSRTNEARSQLE